MTTLMTIPEIKKILLVLLYCLSIHFAVFSQDFTKNGVTKR